MKPSIPTRLFLAVLSACAVVLAVNGVAERFSFERVFLQYLNEQGMQRMQQLATVVAGEYRSHGSWDFMRADPDEWFWNRILPRLVEHVSPPGTTAVPAGHAGSRPEAPAMGASTTRGADTPTAGGTDAPMTKGMDAPAADVASASTKGAEDVPAAGGTKASAAGVTKAPAVEATDAPATGGPYGPEDAPEPPLSDLAGVMLRMALMDTQGRLLMGNPAAATPRGVRLPVRVDGQTVGWLSMLPLEKAVERSDVRFYEAQQRARWLNIAASIAVAALLAWLLSRALLSRLKVLAGGIRRLARGDYGSRLPAGSDDELGRLRDDVNHLAQVLERTEESRRDFMADISHELRTPLAVLRAELEAMQDGIRPLTPDGLQAVQGPVQQLGKLVEDLHELSMAQAEVSYQREPLDVGAVLVQALAGHGVTPGRMPDCSCSGCCRPARCRCWARPAAWSRSSSICWRMRPVIRMPVARYGSSPAPCPAGRWKSSWKTVLPACRPTGGSGSSSVSTGSTVPVPGPGAAADWAWPSASTSCRRIGVRSRRMIRPWEGCASP